MSGEIYSPCVLLPAEQVLSPPLQAVAERVLSERQSRVSTLPTVRPQRAPPRSERRSLQELVDSASRTSPIKQARWLLSGFTSCPYP